MKHRSHPRKPDHLLGQSHSTHFELAQHEEAPGSKPAVEQLVLPVLVGDSLEEAELEEYRRGLVSLHRLILKLWMANVRARM
jgi:hypothetical protein